MKATERVMNNYEQGHEITKKLFPMTSHAILPKTPRTESSNNSEVESESNKRSEFDGLPSNLCKINLNAISSN
jgi:hypothetical protein